MLNDLQQLISSLQSFDAKSELVNIVANNKERLTELMQEQLSAGIDKSGKKRNDHYAPLTIYLKNKFGNGLGAVTDRVTFFMTGQLYGSLSTEVNEQLFYVKSPLATFDKMMDRIGEENYGLDYDQRLEFATEITAPQFGKVLLEKTGLKI